MRVAPLIALFSCAMAAPLDAAELRFRDGRHWTSARLLHLEPTYALVLHERGVYTILAEDLTEPSAASFGIRPPTGEELAARAAAQRKPDPEVADRSTSRDASQADDIADTVGKQARESALQAAPSKTVQAQEPAVVHAFSTVLAPQQTFPEVRLHGRVLARLARGAIVQAEGMPPQETSDETGWVVGTIFLHEDGRLPAAFRGAALTGRVQPAGEHRYTDSQGTRHVLAAWRLE